MKRLVVLTAWMGAALPIYAETPKALESIFLKCDNRSNVVVSELENIQPRDPILVIINDEDRSFQSSDWDDPLNRHFNGTVQEYSEDSVKSVRLIEFDDGQLTSTSILDRRQGTLLQKTEEVDQDGHVVWLGVKLWDCYMADLSELADRASNKF